MANSSLSSKIVVCFALHREAGAFLRLFPRKQLVDRDTWIGSDSSLKHDVWICITGVGKQAAEQRVRELLTQIDASILIYAGFAGGLCDSLKIGDLVTERIWTSDHLIADPEEKRQLHQEHNVLAVDMESAYVAKVCQSFDVPYYPIRVISDTVATRLSPQLVSLLSGGKVSIPKVLKKIVSSPTILTELLRLGRDTKYAANVLAKAIWQELLRSHTGNQ